MTASSQGTPQDPRLRELWRTRKVSFLVIGMVVLLPGLYVALVAVPNVYEAETVLVIRSGDEAGTSLLGRDFAPEITSSTILVPVLEGVGKIPAGMSPSERQIAVDELKESLKIAVRSGAGGETEIQISSRGHSGEELAKLVNLTAQTYVAECQKRSKTQADNVEKLRREATQLSEDFKRIGDRKAAAEAALKSFETEHADVLGEAGEDPETLLKGLIEQQKADAQTLDKTQSEIAGLETAEGLLRTRLKEVPEFIETKEVTTVRDPEYAALEHEIRMMERQLEEMLKTYTFKHPNVVELQTNLLLKRRQLRQFQDRVEDSVTHSKKDNPEYALLKGKLDDTVVKLQVERSSLPRLSARQEALAKRITSLQGLIGSYRKLKNDLAEAQKQYNQLEATLRDRNDKLTIALKAVEAVPEINRLAAVPTVPVGPRRSLYLLGVLVLAVLAARLAMSAAFRLGTGFASEYELGRITGVPVAGSISALAGTEAHRRERLRKRIKLAVLLGLVVLVIAAVTVMLKNPAETRKYLERKVEGVSGVFRF